MQTRVPDMTPLAPGMSGTAQSRMPPPNPKVSPPADGYAPKQNVPKGADVSAEQDQKIEELLRAYGVGGHEREMLKAVLTLLSAEELRAVSAGLDGAAEREDEDEDGAMVGRSSEFDGVGNVGGGGTAGGANMSLEDLVLVLLAKIMKRFERKILADARRLEALNAASSLAPRSAAARTSIDMEMMKLKRTMDKRSQMMDTFRSIIDKLDQTAQNVIRSIAQ